VVRSLALQDHLCSGNTFENSDERTPNTARYGTHQISISSLPRQDRMLDSLDVIFDSLSLNTNSTAYTLH
jgi:hypothetical protein